MTMMITPCARLKVLSAAVLPKRVSVYPQSQDFDPNRVVSQNELKTDIAIRPQCALRSLRNPNATLDTLAPPADDARHH
jgi:hypothetical protein